ncbi:hypothetical protein NESM_000515600 [Novymonas esmeraldas]|uniref:RNase III domain-containing protein n=1 Tax=Novymonas esmeraldas TaxID=1808958 RepID=A0AAW0EP63_9TRYP
MPPSSEDGELSAAATAAVAATTAATAAAPSSAALGTVEDVFNGCLNPSTARSPARHALVRIVKLWLAQHSILKSTTPDVFFAQPDHFGWSAAPDFLRYWVAVVAQKFNKFAASEHTYLNLPPSEQTEWLTYKTAILVNVGNLRSAFQQQLLDVVSAAAQLAWPLAGGDDGTGVVEVFMAVVFVLIFYERPAIAARAVEAVFLAILAQQQDNFTLVPKLISYFVPHMTVSGTSFADRVALVADQLILRGFCFSVAFSYAGAAAAATASPPSSPRPSTTAAVSPGSDVRSSQLVPMSVREVVQRVRELSSSSSSATMTAEVLRIRSRIERCDGTTSEAEGVTFSKYLSLVVEECRCFYVRCQQASKKQVKGGETLLRLEPHDVQGVMRKLQKMLRFASPYYEHIVQRGVWAEILRSDGWVPLQFIEDELAAQTNSVVAKLPSRERLEIVESLLRQHDNFQRFQVDACPIRGSPFHGQRCARSVYGHEIRNPPLYRQIICQPECLVRPDDAAGMAGLPLFGWIALVERPLKALTTHPSIMPLFDNIPFFVVMPPEAIGAFRDYEECIPQAKKYDQKLRKQTLWFAEVYLRAIARDGAAMLTSVDSKPVSSASSASTATLRRDAPSLPSGSVTAPSPWTEVYTKVQGESNAVTQRWYVFPQYHVRKAQRAAGTDATDAVTADATVRRTPPGRAPTVLGLPKMFFTGRVAELREIRSTEVSRHVALDSEGCSTGISASKEEEGEEEGEEEEDCNDGASRPHRFTTTAGDERRGTPKEFCADPVGDKVGGEAEPAAAAAALCEYVIDAYRAPSSALPDVVVRARGRGSGAAGVSICLATQEEATSHYSRCFPPSRVQSIFADYADEAMPEVLASVDDDCDDADDAGDARRKDELAAAAEWQRMARGGDVAALRRLGRWGAHTKAVPHPQPPLPQKLTAGMAPVLPDDTTFDVAPLLDTLVAFIASDQFSCVLDVRVRTAAGVSLVGCRQGVAEAKAFARARGLQYSLLGQRSSKDADGAADHPGWGLADGGEDAVPPRSVAARAPVGTTAARTVRDLDRYEFRKRVTWSSRDLEHIVNELQLQPGDIPLSTLADALTRECEDSASNYELLEFIGDAVMDFLVVADACLVANAARQCSGAATSPSPQTRWEPTQFPLPLPQHSWLDAGVALTSVMESSVTATVCRNAVIGELLPPTVSRHFNKERYPQLLFKVRADVFEAIVGAAYCSGLGLDRIRGLLRRLFSFLPAATRVARLACSASVDTLFRALLGCPYVLEDDAYVAEQLFGYRTTRLLELAPRLARVEGEDDGAGAASRATHLAAASLPRIQGKEFASMFTTGSPVYSYRRLHSFDAARLHNRILHLFSERTIGFVNEIITGVTHLVLDLDKVHPRSWGLLRIVWEWYQQHFSCPAAIFALDSSGTSVVSGSWKDSCHVHLPQVTVSIETWASLVEHIRAWVVAHLAEKATRLRDSLVAHVEGYRVWLHRKALLRAVHAAGGQPRPHMWDFCDSASLLVLARASRAVRLSVLEHVAYTTQTPAGLAAFAAIHSDADVFYGSWKQNEEMVVLEYRGESAPQRQQHRLIVPLPWFQQLQRGTAAEVRGSDGAASSEAMYEPSQFWEDAIDQGLIKSKKLRLYLNDKCDTKYGVEQRPLVLDTLLVVPVRSARATTARPDVTVTQYRPQRPNQPLVEITDASCARRSSLADARAATQQHMRRLQRSRTTGGGEARRSHSSSSPSSPPSPSPASPPHCVEPIAWDCDGVSDDPEVGWVVECAHSSTLALSSLRTLEYRGTDAMMYTSWVDCPPGAEDGALFSQTGVRDTLASFEDVYEHRVELPGRLECTSWLTWLNAFLLRGPQMPFKDDSKVDAWSPAWWAFDARQRTTTLYVATEPVLRLADTSSLAAALAPPSAQHGGGGAMERFAQLFMPQVSYAKVPPLKVKYDTYGAHTLPLFPQTTVKRVELAAPSSPAYPGPVPPSPGPDAAGAASPRGEAPAKLTVLPGAGAAVDGVAAAATAIPSESSPLLNNTLISPSLAIVSLAAHVPRGGGGDTSTTAPASSWVWRAIAYVFSATAARAEVGCLPLVVCESHHVRNQVDAELHASVPGRRRHARLYILSLQDMECIKVYVAAAGVGAGAGAGGGGRRDRRRRLLQHIFFVTAADVGTASASGGPSGASSPAVDPPHVQSERVRALQDALFESVRRTQAPRLYVSDDALRDKLRDALRPSGRVL